jgi:hypothetical protein
MKIKKIYFYTFFILGFCACKKEMIVGGKTKSCCFTYDIEGTFNGQNWQRNGWEFGASLIDATETIKDTTSFNYKCLEGLVGFTFGLDTKELFGRESLIIDNVSKKAKKYGVILNSSPREPCAFSRDSVRASFIVAVEDGDIITDTYEKLVANYPNSFEVLSYEPVKNEFNCRFDFAFIKTRKFDPNYPDTLYLKGKIRIDGRLKQ